MCKQEFLDGLRKKLSGLPKVEIEERIRFYSEMIDDAVEEGLTEQAAIERIAGEDAIEPALPHKPRKERSAWVTVLLIVGSPVWFSLAVAALAVAFSLVVSLWSIIVSLWAAFGGVVGGAIGGVLAGGVIVLEGYVLTGVALAAAGLVCAGLSIGLFLGSKAATRSAWLLTKWTLSGIRSCFVRREKEND